MSDVAETRENYGSALLDRIYWRNKITDQSVGGMVLRLGQTQSNVNRVGISVKVDNNKDSTNVDTEHPYWWIAFAACKDRPEPFELPIRYADEARVICAQCPALVKQECKKYGDKYELALGGMLYALG